MLANLRRGIFPASFEAEATVLSVPVAPDFIFAGKFSKDSTLDLVFAARGGRSVYLMTGDGKGGFNTPQEVAVEGAVTALASAQLDASKAYAGLVIALSEGDASNILVFDGATELEQTTPRKIQMNGKVSSLLLAHAGGNAQDVDLFGLEDGSLFTVRQIANSSGAVERIATAIKGVDIAVGEFIQDREARAEIAVLSHDGIVSYLTRGSLDSRPLTTEEVREIWRQNGGRGHPSKLGERELSGAWTLAESHQTGLPARRLQKAYLTGNAAEDLLVVDTQSKRVRVLFREPGTGADRASSRSEIKSQDVSMDAAPVSVLPMRLSVMGQQGFVFFTDGSLEPNPVLTAPAATFVVTKTADTNDGACNADCSLREAVIAANAAAGADMITFGTNGTFQLTIAGANENASAMGDLDVTQALTIVGNGTGNTIVQAGSNATDGIDKVFSVNPSFTLAFASSFSGMTIRYGRNPSAITGDGFGGGLDWEGSGAGTLSLSNVIVDQNTATDGRGGGLALTNSNNGAATITNSTISNNVAARTSGTGGVGGGIFVGTNCPISLTTVTVSGNSATSPNSDGGGINFFGHAGSTTTLTGVTITNNSCTVDGGGISTARSLTLNPPTVISQNSSQRYGGGLSMLSANTTVTLSKATLVGNSATTSGGALAVGANTPNQILNLSFSRVVGNTGGGFTGVVTRGGTANVENNWWGCNSGPGSAPCNTVGVDGAGAVDFDPWLRFTHTASPGTIIFNQSSSLTASFLTNSAGTAIAPSNLDVLIGLPISFGNAVRGTISGAQTTIQSNGTATATFNSTSAGAGSADATVDSGIATASITINKASTTTTINVG